jgi:hypothetical protein
MKRWKMFGVAVAVSALAALTLASAASANTITDSAGNGTPTIHLVSEESAVSKTNHILIHNDIADIECESTIQFHVTNHGSGVTTSGAVQSLTFSNCTGGWFVHTISAGTFEVHTVGTSGHGLGTVTWSGMTITATRFGVHCSYRTENTHLGVLTGGSLATLDLEAQLPRHGGSFFCGGSTAAFTGAYKTTETVKIDA